MNRYGVPFPTDPPADPPVTAPASNVPDPPVTLRMIWDVVQKLAVDAELDRRERRRWEKKIGANIDILARNSKGIVGRLVAIEQEIPNLPCRSESTVPDSCEAE